MGLSNEASGSSATYSSNERVLQGAPEPPGCDCGRDGDPELRSLAATPSTHHKQALNVPDHTGVAANTRPALTSRRDDRPVAAPQGAATRQRPAGATEVARLSCQDGGDGEGRRETLPSLPASLRGGCAAG